MKKTIARRLLSLLLAVLLLFTAVLLLLSLLISPLLLRFFTPSAGIIYNGGMAIRMVLEGSACACMCLSAWNRLKAMKPRYGMWVFEKGKE